MTTTGLRQPRTSARMSGLGLPAIGAVIAIAIWWAATVVFEIKTLFLPAPPDIVEAFLRQPSFLLENAWATLWKTLIGFVVAAGAGLLTAVVLSMSRTVERATMPLLVALNSLPKVAVAPLLMVWLGFGWEPKVVMVLLICFFPVVVSAMSGLTSTPADLGELTKSMSASWWRSYFKVRLPWALPQIFVGLKVAISLALIGAVVAEINNPGVGLGGVIVLAGTSFDTPMAFAAIVLLALMSIILFYSVAALERLLLPWARDISA